MNTESATTLAQSTKQRAREAEERTQQALRDMNKDGAAITFAAVAKRARVSRAFLYANVDLRSEIDRLRELTAGAPSSVPATERATEQSLRARLDAALADNKRLRGELQAMRDELALAHGRARELEAETFRDRATA